jgi:DNA-binding CsgD family transcriptional regulator
MLSVDQHNEIVARIYASALGQASWQSCMERVATLFGTTASLCQTADSNFRYTRQENYGYSSDFAASFYASEVFAKDPRPPYFRAIIPGNVYYDHCLFDVDEMYRDARVLESCDILGVKYQLGTVVTLPNGNIGTFTLLSNDKEGHATQDAIDAFRRLVPHIEQALSLGHVLEYGAAKEHALLEALAHKADGIIILARNGLPTFLNDAAQKILAEKDGLHLTRDGFSTARAPETRRLQAMIAGALETWNTPTRGPGGQMLVTRISGRRPLVLRVMPSPPGGSMMLGTAAACTIHIHDLAAENLPSRASLHAVFGLSERECDLAIELIRCINLAAAATNAGMALNTARNHLQNIFRKCGIASQAEAIQLFSRIL